jgi:hypothetical protein
MAYIGFAALILSAVMAPETKSNIAASIWRRIVRVSWCAIIGIVALGFAIGVAAESRLPIVVVAGQFTTLGRLLSWAAAALGALALASLVVRTRGSKFFISG